MSDRTPRRSTRLAVPSVTSTWRSANRDQQPVQIAVGHMEKEQALDNAYDEYRRLKKQGAPVTATQFCDRFPSYRKSLRRLIDVHEALEDYSTDGEDWPELFSVFLGFEIMHELGVGAIARVYLAAETALGGRLVAVKVAQHGHDEADTLGKLSHPNIVPVHSVQYDPETEMTAVCMPYFGSATLADLLDVGFEKGTPPDQGAVILEAARQREQLVGFVDPPDEKPAVDRPVATGSYVDGVVHLGIQMAEALEYTHERGILHRDLKPSNVLLTPEGVPMLLDFNLATDIESEVPRLGGTLPYMPPEQIEDVHLRPFEADLAGDPRSDLFSLGVILYELLTGRLPFGDPPAGLPPKEAGNAYLEAQKQSPRPPSELNPAVERSLDAVLMRCLSLDVAERPQTAAELAAELSGHFSARKLWMRWGARHAWLLGTASAVVLTALALLIGHLVTRPPEVVRSYNKGVAAMGLQRFDDALDYFERAYELYPDYPAILFARGMAKQRLGQNEMAMFDLLEVVEADAPIVWECCAYSSIHAGNATSSLRNYERLKALDPENPDPDLFLNLAHGYYWVNDVGYTISYAKKALAVKPSQSGHYLLALGWKGATLKGKGTPEHNIAEAIKNIDAALKTAAPDDAQLLYDACTIYAMSADPAHLPRLRELLKQAAQAGASKRAISSLASDKQWRTADWFVEVLALAQGKGSFNDPKLRHARFVTPPDYDEVQRYLSEQVIELPEEP